jgi:hypothetical protein
VKIIRQICILALFLGGLEMARPGSDTRAEAIQPARETFPLPAAGQAASAWSPLFSPPGTSFQVQAIAVSGENVYVGGGFVTAGDVEAHYIARWNTATQTWSAMGSLDEAVTAIYASGDQVYAGGEGFVSRWNATSNAWEEFGHVYGYVNAITGSGGYIYVGGSFSQIDSLTANYVARWNLQTSTWEALGSGMDNVVYALAVGGNTLYLGGKFDHAGGTTASRIAQLDLGSSLWSPLGTGLTGGEVRTLAFYNTDLYVGGAITETGGVTVTNVARWSGGQWYAMGHNLADYGTIYGVAAGPLGVYATAEVDAFDSHYGVRWNPASQSWEQLGGGLECFFSYCAVYAVAMGASQVYFGGDFVVAGGQSAFRVAAWNVPGSTWEPLYNGPGGNGLDGNIYAIAVNGTDIYVGGDFNRAGPIEARSLARWDTLTHTWHPVGGGVIGVVRALLFVGDNLFVGGNLNVDLGAVRADFIARWDTVAQTWHALGQGASPGLNDTVEALAVKGSQLIVGGLFYYIDSGAASANTDYIAVWDLNGQTWTPINANLKNSVYSLLVDGDNVYVGGAFYKNAGSDYEHIARWDTHADTWHEVGGGLGSNVHALVKFDGRIVAGGSFADAVRQFNPALDTWERLPGGGLSGGFYYGAIVYDLLVAPGGDLLAGGDFDQAGPHTAHMIAQYSPSCSQWLRVGQGFNARVEALGLYNGTLYAGGQFSLADSPSSRFGSHAYSPLRCAFVPAILR